MRANVCFLAVFWAIGCANSVFGQNGPNDIDSKNKFQYAIRGWQAERERLTRGKVKMAGTYEISKNGVKREPLGVVATFDDLQQVKRFYIDWRGKSGWWQQTAEWTASCPRSPSSTVHLRSTTEKRLSFAMDIDPRCFGAAEFGEFELGDKLTLKAIVSSWEGGEEGNSKLMKESDGVYEFESLRKMEAGGFIRVRFCINERKGFAFERLDIETKDSLTDPNEEWCETSTTHSDWREINKHWVPVRMVTSAGILKRRTIELDLDWLNVGEPFADDEFRLDNLGPSKGTPVYDGRLDPDHPIHLGAIEESPEPPPVLKSEARPLSPRIIGILVANGVLLAILAGVYYWRRRRKAKFAG